MSIHTDSLSPKSDSYPACPRLSRRHLHLMFMRGLLVLGAAVSLVRADTVEMQNGDRYNGKILSVDTNTVVIQNDVLGTVRLPRDKMANLIVNADARTNGVVAAPATPRQLSAPTNPVIDLSSALRQLGANTNFIQQVQSQMLSSAGPEANKKFNELVGGMMSGKITVNDIRAEANSAVKQLKELKRDLGEGAGDDLDGYLAILEGFLRETTPESKGATNAPPAQAAKALPNPKK